MKRFLHFPTFSLSRFLVFPSLRLRSVQVFCFLVFPFSCFPVFSQQKEDNFRALFIEAGYHVEYKSYALALPIYLKLDSLRPGNANIQYRIGLCYLNSAMEKTKAIPYLEYAVINATRDYDDLSYIETNAPLESWFLLGKSYHFKEQFDSAIATIRHFQTLLSKKHVLLEETDRYLAMCSNARDAMKNPIDVTIENPGDLINTPFPEYAPVITADESMLIFTSRRETTTGGVTDLNGEYMEDVYVSYHEFGVWIPAKGVGTSINTVDHDAAIGLSHDGQILFLYRDDDGDGNIYQSELMGDIWTVPEKLSVNINSPSWETHASLTSDGQTIFFVSDRKGGFGGRDIYRCKIMPDGEWSLAQNLGPSINTSFDEDAPFIHSDDKTLYFSSNGQKTMGGFDIFYSELQENEQWSQPTNIGYPINTVDDDVFFVLTANGKKGYFSSARTGSKGEKDIFTAVFKQKEASNLTVLRGVMEVFDEQENPIEAQVVVIDNVTGQELIYRPNAKTGKYLIILQPGADYEIQYFSNGMKVHSENLMIPEESAYQLIEKPLDLNVVSYSGEVKMSADTVKTQGEEEGAETDKASSSEMMSAVVAMKHSIKEVQPYFQYFGYNMKDIDTASAVFKAFADKAIAYLNKAGHLKFLVEASSSKVPSTSFNSNMTLSKVRAGTAKTTFQSYLRSRGVDPEKVTLKMDARVQGPEYKKGSASNISRYEKFQYVKVIPFE